MKFFVQRIDANAESAYQYTLLCNYVQLFAQFCIDTCKNRLPLVQNLFKNGRCTDMYICTLKMS